MHKSQMADRYRTAAERSHKLSLNTPATSSVQLVRKKRYQYVDSDDDSAESDGAEGKEDKTGGHRALPIADSLCARSDA